MKKIVIAAILAAITLLHGCQPFTYSVSEQKINQALQKRNNFTKDINLPGAAVAHIEIANLTSAIGREEPEKISLTGSANLELQSLLGHQKTTIDLKIKALPVFDKQNGALFLQELEITEMTAASRKLQAVAQTLIPYLNQSLASYFNQRPVYVLREDAGFKQALAKKAIKGIEIKPGEIIISLLD